MSMPKIDTSSSSSQTCSEQFTGEYTLKSVIEDGKKYHCVCTVCQVFLITPLRAPVKSCKKGNINCCCLNRRSVIP